jgi:hypothetical protein
MSAVESTASFIVQGDPPRTAAEVTQRLSMNPSSSHEAGELPRPRANRPVDWCSWQLTSSDHLEVGVEPFEQIERLLVVLEPKQEELWALVQAGYHARWRVVAETYPLEHDITLPRDLLARLVRVPGDLYLDVFEGRDDNGERSPRR